LKRAAFENYLKMSSVRRVRLQWDPDHDPQGNPIKKRRAIQLGLKGLASFSSGDDILDIVDMTPFIPTCDRSTVKGICVNLVTPKETEYPLSEELKKHLGAD
jgi:hypothetical protein